MAEKQPFIQIVDIETGMIEKIVAQSDIESMSAEEKLALSRSKNLFIVTHKLTPVVKVEMKKTVISEPVFYSVEKTIETEDNPIEELSPDPVEKPKFKGRPKKG